MYNFNDITVVCVDGRLGSYNSSVYSLIRAKKFLPGCKTKFFSGRPIDLRELEIENVCLQPLGYLDYSIFLTYILDEFIETEFVLIVQDDGWVLDGSNWSDDFFNYDYIGAPSHLAKVMNSDGSVQIFNGYQWTKFYEKTGYSLQVLYNGGFSLRSKKLIGLPKSKNLPYVIGSSSRFDFNRNRIVYDPTTNEDVQITFENRSFFESYGCVFAPLNVAKFFSIENWNSDLYIPLDLPKILGQHKQYRKLTSAFPLSVTYEITEGYFDQFDERPIYEYIKSISNTVVINNDYIKKIGF